jgi:hypothetical protein
MQIILLEPDLRPDNLPRIRDAVDLALRGLRDRMKRSEETWVREPADAYWKQENPLILAANNFLTRVHAYHRLSWLLRTGDEETQGQFAGFIGLLEDLPGGRTREDVSAILGAVAKDASTGEDSRAEEIRSSLAFLSPDAASLAKDALEDLRLALSEIPGETLSKDWKYLINQMKADLAIPPEETLRRIADLLALIGRRDNVRGFVTAREATWNEIQSDLEAAVRRLGTGESRLIAYTRRPVVLRRMEERYGGMGRPTYVGLINESTRSGVHINTAEHVTYADIDEEHIMKFLAARLYGGGGAHSLFMKTWGAGLAYSNGVGASEASGRISYYAERCPDLAQTMQFVVNEIKNAPHDPSLANYAVAQVFSTNRAGNRYESRCEAMAADLADGLTPDIVRRYRATVMKLLEGEDLYDRLHDLMPATYGEIMPGLGPTAKECPGAIYFLIGPEKQLESYEEYLKSVEGNDVKLHRIYPRDFWLVPSTAD